jgi:hypothetical protein
VGDVSPGECTKVRVRGEKIWLCNAGGVVGAFGTRCVHSGAPEGDGEPCRHYRAQVRGAYVYVALDLDANEAPADVHLSDREPQSTPD